jgi:hypothetical protein
MKNKSHSSITFFASSPKTDARHRQTTIPPPPTRVNKFGVFSEIRRIWTDLNLKFAEFTVHCFKISEKIKISKKYVKKLDRIVRLLVKNFFVKPSRLGW